MVFLFLNNWIFWSTFAYFDLFWNPEINDQKNPPIAPRVKCLYSVKFVYASVENKHLFVFSFNYLHLWKHWRHIPSSNSVTKTNKKPWLNFHKKKGFIRAPHFEFGEPNSHPNSHLGLCQVWVEPSVSSLVGCG